MRLVLEIREIDEHVVADVSAQLYHQDIIITGSAILRESHK